LADPKLLIKKSFPTTRREAIRIPFSVMCRTEKLTTPEYRDAIEQARAGPRAANAPPARP